MTYPCLELGMLLPAASFLFDNDPSFSPYSCRGRLNCINPSRLTNGHNIKTASSYTFTLAKLRNYLHEFSTHCQFISNDFSKLVVPRRPSLLPHPNTSVPLTSLVGQADSPKGSTHVIGLDACMLSPLRLTTALS